MANQPVCLGLYGCGNRTRALLDAVYGEGWCSVGAAFDRDPARAHAVCERYGGTACASSAELIATPAIDAFIISLDPFAHPDAFDETLAAGKPIFLEKPIAMSAERAFRMMQAANDRKVPVHVGLMRRYGPEQIAARRFVADNPPGRCFGVSCRWLHPGETEMLNFLKNAPDNFRLKLSQIPFHACHALDVMRTYGGEVRTVRAMGGKWTERPYPSPDYVMSVMEFENGAIGGFHYSSMSYRAQITYMVHYENYTLTFENGLEVWRRPPLRAAREGALLLGPETGSGFADCRPVYHANIGPDRTTFGTGQQTALIMKDFLDSVRNGTPVKVGIEDGYKVAELAEAIETSFAQGREIQLPLFTPDGKPPTHA